MTARLYLYFYHGIFHLLVIIELRMKKKDICILLIDDEPDILEITEYHLALEGYRIITGRNGIEAVRLAEKHHPRLIILDVMMPEMDGIQACEEIRKNPELKHTLISFLTARGEDYSQMAGLAAGADDYITKPIKPKLLVTKVKALLRRFREKKPSSAVLEIGDLVINKDEYRIIKNDKEYTFPKKEFELLNFLASKPGSVFSREEILENIWGNGTAVGGRTIDVHIRKLREKIGEQSLETVKGVGYKLVVEE